jgi:hypothetical protein
MRILALDHGTKRIGVAVSDELKMLAQPVEFIPAEPFSEFPDSSERVARGEAGRIDPGGNAAQYERKLRAGCAQG